MRTDVLIVGQGICGSFLSHYLEEEGLSCLVIDEERAGTASKAAAGIINPVTGRRIVKTWMIDELIPLVQEAYGVLGKKIGASLLGQTEIVEFFPTPQMRNAFVERCAEGADYLSLPEAGNGRSGGTGAGTGPWQEDQWREWFHYELGYGVIQPCHLVDLAALIGGVRRRLRERSGLLEERFEATALEVGETGIRYKEVQAGCIVFCEGAGGFGNPYFRNLPFAPNKGEALIVEIKGLPEGGTIFKKGMVLAPWRDGSCWLGSSYEWSFTEAGPTERFRQRAEAQLKEWVRAPWRIVDHIASVRPATIERRPFVGFHPQHRGVALLNGMGTKGCSLAPYFARQLAGALARGLPIQADADVARFSKVLKRSQEGPGAGR